MSHPLHAFFVKIPVFSGLSVSELEDIVRIVRPVQVGSLEVVFAEGAAGDAAFVVQGGLVEVYRRVNGKDVVLQRLGPGALFGEVALVDGAPRSASVRALEATQLLRIDRAEFDLLRRQLRPAAYVIIRSIAVTLASRIRETNTQVATLLAPTPEPPPETPERGGLLHRLFGGRR